MTASSVLDSAAAVGCDVYLKPNGQPTVKGKPNAALLAALKEHRAEIVILLGGDRPREWCSRCETWVYEAEDSEAFCRPASCSFRRKARHGGVPI